MEKQTTEQPDIKKIFLQILFVASAFILPSLDWLLFSWMYGLLPTLAFFLLVNQGFYKAKRILLIGGIAGLIGNLFLGGFGLFIFATSLLPVGYILAKGAMVKEGPVFAGTKAFIALALGWAVLLSGIVTPGDVSPYNTVIASFIEGTDEAIVHYQNNSSSSLEVDMMLEETFIQMKTIFPIILPAILGSFGILIVWLSAALGNWMLGRKEGAESPWSSFQTWQLSEKLIWPAILCACATLVPMVEIKYIAINLLILLGLLYSLQGFGITVFLMNKWQVPILFRSFIYVIIVFQSFGTILLLILGIADTWLNLRKVSHTDTQN